jgi:hypothetical protein
MLHLQPEPFGNASAVGWIRFQKMADLPFLNGFGRASQRCRLSVLGRNANAG